MLTASRTACQDARRFWELLTSASARKNDNFYTFDDTDDLLSYNGSVQVLTEILSCLLPVAANDRTGTSVSGAEDREVRWCGEVYRDVPHVVTS